MFRSIHSTLAVAIALVAGSQAVQADTESTSRTVVGRVVVSYQDLDLTQYADAGVLLGRLKKAAFEACGGDPRWHANYTLNPYAIKQSYLECRKDALADAVSTVNEPVLSRAFEADERPLPRVAAK